MTLFFVLLGSLNEFRRILGYKFRLLSMLIILALLRLGFTEAP